MNNPLEAQEDVNEGYGPSRCYRAATLSERISGTAMLRLGFRDPKNHGQWSEIVEAVQFCIDEEIEAMGRIAVQDTIPPIRKVLDYEIRSSLWASWIGVGWVQGIAGRYFAWKTRRKYAAYIKSLEFHDRLLKMADESR